jgi:hypothetical protein
MKTILRRHHGLLFAMSWLISACANPQWENERYHVTGVLAGQSCTLEYHGLPGLPAGRDGRLSLEKVDVINAGVQPGQELKMIDCGGMSIQLQGSRGGLPVVGTYPVSDSRNSAAPPGTTAVLLEDGKISPGHWPFAFDGMVSFVGVSGTVQIDSVTPNAVYGRFDVVGRREPRGS